MDEKNEAKGKQARENQEEEYEVLGKFMLWQMKRKKCETMLDSVRQRNFKKNVKQARADYSEHLKHQGVKVTMNKERIEIGRRFYEELLK